MRYRELGQSGLRVSEIGFGAWGIGGGHWVGADDRDSLRALSLARDAGVTFFDTALVYGEGHSERLVARAFGTSPEVVIATKIPPRNMAWPAPAGLPLADAFPKPYALDCLRQSLRNLGRDTVDLVQFHVWNDTWAAEAEWLATVREIVSSGMARSVGISINDHEPANGLRALDTGLLASAQVIFNLFEQSPRDQLLPFCQQKKLGVIARCPLDEGGLTGKITPATQFPEADFRNFYFAGERKHEVAQHVDALVRDLEVSVSELPSLALRYCLSDPAVSTVIPGMRNPAHVKANAAASDAGPLPPELLERAARHRWLRNFYAA